MSTSSKEYKVANQQKESYNMLVSLVVKFTISGWFQTLCFIINKICFARGADFTQQCTKFKLAGPQQMPPEFNLPTIVLWEWSFCQEGRSGHAGRLHPGPSAHWERPGPVPAVGQGPPCLCPPLGGNTKNITPQLLFSQQCAISRALSYDTFCNHYFSHRIWTFFSSSLYLLHLESFLTRSPLFSVQCHKHFCISSGKTLSKNIWLCQDSARLMTHRHFTSH